MSYLLISNSTLYRDTVKFYTSSLLKGQSSTVAIVGPSNAGKSHSLRGSPPKNGLAQYAANEILNFLTLSRQNREKNYFLAKYSIYHIYREKPIDLLGRNSEEPLKIRKYKENGEIITELVNLQEFDLDSVKGFSASLNKAMDVRKKLGIKHEVKDIKNKTTLVISIKLYKVTNTVNHKGVKAKVTEKYSEINFAEFPAADFALPGCKKIEKINALDSKSIKKTYKTFSNNLGFIAGGQSSIRDGNLTYSLKNTLNRESLIFLLCCLSPSDSPATQKACLDVLF